MIEQHHHKGGTTSFARYSDCKAYRHALHHRWSEGPALGWVMLNPSTATEAQDDPTLARCRTRAARLGFGAIAVANLFAWRATDPAALRQAPDPVGPDADAELVAALVGCRMVICGWGNHGRFLGRGALVLDLLAGRPLHHLGLTRQGQPRHPLYTSYAVRPLPLA